MKTCILHFGMAKTGSTSIQATLLRAPADEAFHYLTLGNGNAGRALATAFMPNARKFQPNRKQGLSGKDLRGRKDDVLAQLEQQFQGPEPLVIVSTGDLQRRHRAPERTRPARRRCGRAERPGAARPTPSHGSLQT